VLQCVCAFRVFIHSIVRRLEVTPDNIIMSFTNVVDEMFADGQYNWGRVVTIYAFAGWLARYCCCGRACDASSMNKASCRDPEPARQMAVCAGEYVAQHLTAWVRKQGGWVSCWMLSLLLAMQLMVHIFVSLY